MIYRFTLVSDDAEDFFREIKIDSDATFFDLHKTIAESCGYADDQMTSFFTCEHSWEKDTEITLEDMGFSSSDEDVYIMRETEISEFLDDEGQRLLYCFDPMNDRYFYMELAEVITGESLDAPVCSKKRGDAPKQVIEFDFANDVKSLQADSLNEFDDFEGFNDDELDSEGLSVSEGMPFED